MSDVNLNNMTLTELREQCRILGISDKGGAKALREAISSALSGDAPEAAPIEEEVADPRKKDWITILIAESDEDRQPVFVGHNGHAYRIKRGEPVEVPPPVVEILNNAKKTVLMQGGKQKQVPSYPFQIVG